MHLDRENLFDHLFEIRVIKRAVFPELSPGGMDIAKD